MKPVRLISLFAAAAISLSGPLYAADAGKGAKPDAAPANPWGDTPTPHQRSSGKPASVAVGQQVFTDHCAICHGLYGKGDGPRSAFFVPGQQYIADLSNSAFVNGRDDQLIQSIREGLRRFPEPSYVMPQFKYILAEDEIKSVLAYIKTLPKMTK